MIEFPRDFKEFLKLLNSKQIEYLVIGGYAVGFHGYPRATGDLNVWISANEKNALKMVEALRQFGFDLPDLNKEVFLKEKKVILMGVPPMRLEILTSIDGVRFDECFSNRVIADFDDFKVNFISKKDLLTNKRASGRPQDMVDFDKLNS
ncbi:MAG: hypothetical protein A2031_06405 [Deltaproteobacteria bacterium RBG_19FT_COMBO_43_11]|nr:MAG: hypothetical protein A2W27_00435 [Deltaproteobacteria bacterium RBG_16_44_11]OGP87326.1 MAG: hypothetical protein A2031_06405 [Deltaproteobacteria bacterium RBG_19FT_COMBO_43_11]